MFLSLDFSSLDFSALNQLVVRGYASEQARPRGEREAVEHLAVVWT